MVNETYDHLKDEVSKQCRITYHETHCDLHRSSSVVKVMKSGMLRWGRYVARIRICMQNGRGECHSKTSTLSPRRIWRGGGATCRTVRN